MSDVVNQYRIRAKPSYRTVTPGAEVTYFCAYVGPPYITSADAPHEKFQWYCYNDREAVKRRGGWTPYIVRGPSGAIWENAHWDFVGRHTIKCCVTFPDGVKCYYEYPQWVDTVEAVLAATFKKAQAATLDPYKHYSLVKRYIKVLKDGAKRYPITDPEKRKKHQEELKQLQAYLKELGKLLAGTWGKLSRPVACAHLAIKEQHRTIVRLLAVQMHDGWRDKRWRLIDWTNPLHPSLRGTYDGTGAHNDEALRNAFEKWDSDNEYWPGVMRYRVRVPTPVGSQTVEGTFKTDGKSFWSSVSDFLNYVALGAAVVAGIVTLVAPVPGSRVVSGLIWTSIFSSTASAVINIGQRHARGVTDWRADAFDGLTIVGNIFAAGWMRCATVLTKPVGNVRFARGVLYGQFATDGIQGILIAEEHYSKFQAILDDTSLTPSERTSKLLELFRSLTIAGAMTYISIRGTRKDLANLRASPEARAKLDRLKDPKAQVDITETPKVKGNTRKKRLRTTAHDEQIRQDAPETTAPAPHGRRPTPRPRHFPRGKPAAKRGMRLSDDLVFRKLARKKKLIIIVRDSNPDALDYIGKKGYKPKPETLKAKTARSGKYKGLAVADPSDPRLQEYLKTKNMTYDQYVNTELKGKGYRVDPPEKGYVVRDGQGNAFYSDYDLHGVYDAKTGQNAYSESLRNELNKDMGGEMIQHGPHDEWPKRNDKNEAGPNYGPQPPCTAYGPDGSTYRLETFDDMRAFYEQHNINWRSLYPNNDYPAALKSR